MHDPLNSQPRVFDGFLSEEECSQLTAEMNSRARGKPMRCALSISSVLKQRLHKLMSSDANGFHDGNEEGGRVPAMWQIGSVAVHQDRFDAGCGDLVDGYVAVVYLAGSGSLAFYSHHESDVPLHTIEVRSPNDL